MASSASTSAAAAAAPNGSAPSSSSAASPSSSHNPYTLAVIGCGTMGIAILSGVLDSQRSLLANNPSTSSSSRGDPAHHRPGVTPRDLSMSLLDDDGHADGSAELTYLPSRYHATVARPESAKRLARVFAPYLESLEDVLADEELLTVHVADNVGAAQRADVVLLACKPNMVRDILEEPGMRRACKGKLLVSICAGLRIAQMREWVDEDTEVVRAMPNTPAKIRQGMTILSSLTPRSPHYDSHRRILLSLFSAVGRCRFLDEKHFDACTALAGSGPAFACVFLEAMADGGVMMGLPRKEALELAAQTMQGAARMVMQSGMHPAAIKDSVTTPGGCTIAGLLNLEDGKVRSTVARTIQAAAEHASGLGQAKK